MLRRHRLRKLGEDVTRTLETTPRQWKVIETCGRSFLPGLRDDQPGAGAVPCRPEGMGGPEPACDDRVREVRPASAAEPAGRALCARRRADRALDHGRRGRRGRTALDPLRRLVEAHVMAAERLHGDDTTVPVLAKGKTDTGRCWIYVRDDGPFGGAGPPAAMFYYSRDRSGEHPQGIWRGMPASCRPTPMTATTSSTLRTASPARSGRPRAGPTHGASSL